MVREKYVPAVSIAVFDKKLSVMYTGNIEYD